MCTSIITAFNEGVISIKIVILILLFGTGSWVAVNGIWVELPILVNHAPEQWSLPSYLTVVIQLANIGPIAYLLAHKYISYKSRKIVREVPVIYFILCVGIIASFLLAFTWKETSEINDKSYSTALILLSFFLATVDCTSSVTFLPFMAFFPPEYMTVFYIGAGMSGFLPSIVALIQGIGKQSYTCEWKFVTKNITRLSILSNSSAMNLTEVHNTTEVLPRYFREEQRFSAQIFFIFIALMMIVSLISFIALVRIKNNAEMKEKSSDVNAIQSSSQQDSHELHAMDSYKDLEDYENDDRLITDSEEPYSWKEIYFLLVLNGLINAVSNGILPSIQSYACLPYGNNIYHLTLTLSAVINPLACFLYFFVGIQSAVTITIGVAVYLLSASYILVIAIASPCPLLNDTAAGGIIVVRLFSFSVCWILFSMFHVPI